MMRGTLITKVHIKAVAMSLYQASEEMYGNSDHVILLYEGHQIRYFGPAAAATAYFTKLRFVKPS
ncbi:uncharacterized protein F4812DRAFT_425311 [Daldinia caldariorum]|uniref:uncharacterized protein n=1 Tax=Daldinia caldariorum TaxID=326644 RepID=UPI002008783B|nr:uncharacterized protein F4812DRAFT_425311 [Daldinia caldariorum]KAI1468960.1 hypothetical protein F4812DRAFT_425311 [Daldinia caldariorum]